MRLNLTTDEKAVLIGLLAGLVERDPFPESERVQQLRRILTKLRAGSTNVSASDDPIDPDLTEPTDIDEAEVLRFGADFESGKPEPSARVTPRKPGRSGRGW